MTRWLEIFMYGTASLFLGWFAPKIFLNANWAPRTRLIFATVLTVAIFVALGTYRLSTGQDFTEAVETVALCPWLPLSHCPKPNDTASTQSGAPPHAPRVQPAPTPTSSPAIAGAPAQPSPPVPFNQNTPVPDEPDAASTDQQQARAEADPSQAGSALPAPNQQNPTQSPGASKPRSIERFGITVFLDSLAETKDRYVATLRITNSGSADANIALLSSQWSRADFFLTDSSGGSCQMAANGEGWGSLSAIIIGSFNIGGTYALIPAGGEARHFIYFNKMRCSEQLTETTGISLNGTFILSDGSQVPVSFSDLSMTLRQ